MAAAAAACRLALAHGTLAVSAGSSPRAAATAAAAAALQQPGSAAAGEEEEEEGQGGCGCCVSKARAGSFAAVFPAGLTPLAEADPEVARIIQLEQERQM